MSQQRNRRNFLKVSAVIGAGVYTSSVAGTGRAVSPNEKLNMASVGIDGKGRSDSSDAGRHGNMIAICDVDTDRLEKVARRYPDAKKYTDYRKLLDEVGAKLDGITVSTPDHMHALVAARAMRMGIHCFCQKPMTHTISEARLLGELAKEKKLATQMGNQGTAGSELRKAAALLRVGAIGKVAEVHVWTNRPIWPQGGPRPAPAEVPSTLEWGLWLGCAPERPYAEGAYHPFRWRGWWDFGTGALGDMACHTMNMPFMGLDLRDPTSVVAETSGHNGDSYPKSSKITFEFPANDWRGPITYYWYDGGNKAPLELLKGQKMSGSGCVVVGEKANLFSGNDYGGGYKILGDVTEPEVEFTRSPGHFEEWVGAIKGGPEAVSNFPNYAGPLTETVLLGNLAVWAAAEGGVGKKIEWDAKNLKPTNAPEVEKIVRKEYRQGFDPFEAA